MSNYVQSIDFSDKDALPSGNPAKLARGADIDTELALIAAAISSKEDLANKGVSNGYAGLDGSGDVPRAQLPTPVAYEDENNVFTAATQIVSAVDSSWRAVDGAITTKLQSTVLSNIGLVGTQSNHQVGIITNNVARLVISADGTAVTFAGVSMRDTAIINTGTFADARIALSNVTQHQASLSIAETQISNGTIFPRIAEAETITGQYTFSTLPLFRTAADEQARFGGNASAPNPFISFYDNDGVSRKAYIQVLDGGQVTIANETVGAETRFVTVSGGAVTVNGNLIWHAANDGAGSGLDADLLDGQSGAFYQNADNLNAGTVPAARIGSSTDYAIGSGSTINSQTIGYRDVPRRTSGFARGEALAISAGVTLNTSDLAAGRAFSVYNDSAAAITITQGSGVTLRLAGTATTGNRTLAARGLMTIWCNSGTEAIASGSGVS